jgi:hypothetical protein
MAMRVRRPEQTRGGESPVLDPSTLRGRRWVTRPRPNEEARGIDVATRALLAATSDDHQVLEHGHPLLEGLCATTPTKEEGKR